ncbi:hypothetical protein [Terricaulis sp.]|uniref:hypothetical protein n=1 Tax=Terricaulis sp. TaxID=2768686 RepID=UPI003783B68B
MRVFVFLASLLFATAATAQQPREPLFSAVEAYGLFQGDISGVLDADIDSPQALTLALERAARHDPVRLTRGWMAYGALTAAQSPAFVGGVRARVHAAGRAAVLRQLRRDVTYARRRPPGAAEAIQLILNANAGDGARLGEAAARIDQLGDTLNASTWVFAAESREDRTTRFRQLARERWELQAQVASRLHIGVMASQPLATADGFGGRRFWDELDGRGSNAVPMQTRREAAPATIDRMLTLAALYIVSATPQESARVSELIDDRRTSDCLELAQLQYRQCASVAHDANEDAYCLARHGLAGPAQCFSAIGN